jgi:hypothetical protein
MTAGSTQERQNAAIKYRRALRSCEPPVRETFHGNLWEVL